MQIYIVEDSDIDYEILAEAFRENKYPGEIKRFDSGLAALEEMKSLISNQSLSHLPSLILSDINMPGFNGFEFCQEIMKTDELLTIPVLLISNSKSPDDIKKAYKAGARNLLNKRLEYDDQVKDVKVLIEYWLNGVAQVIK